MCFNEIYVIIDEVLLVSQDFVITVGHQYTNSEQEVACNGEADDFARGCKCPVSESVVGTDGQFKESFNHKCIYLLKKEAFFQPFFETLSLEII